MSLLLGLVALTIGMSMVLMAAFRSHQRVWGIGIFILPVIIPLYAMLNWAQSRVRNGFYISVIGGLVAAIALYAGAANDLMLLSSHVPNKQLQKQVDKIVTKVPTAGPPSTPLPNEKEASKITFKDDKDYDPLYSAEAYATVDVEPLLPETEEKNKVEPIAPTPIEFQEIAIDDLDLNHNKQLKLTTKEGQVIQGKLIDSNQRSLSLEMPYENGLVAFQYNFDSIDKLSVSDAVTSSVPQKEIAPEPVQDDIQEPEIHQDSNQ